MALTVITSPTLAALLALPVVFLQWQLVLRITRFAVGRNMLQELQGGQFLIIMSIFALPILLSYVGKYFLTPHFVALYWAALLVVGLFAVIRGINFLDLFDKKGDKKD